MDLKSHPTRLYGNRFWLSTFFRRSPRYRQKYIPDLHVGSDGIHLNKFLLSRHMLLCDCFSSVWAACCYRCRFYNCFFWYWPLLPQLPLPLCFAIVCRHVCCSRSFLDLQGAVQHLNSQEWQRPVATSLLTVSIDGGHPQ